MTHGYSGSSTSYSHMWKNLSSNYRLVFFDNFGWGMNTRLQECSGMESVEAADKWVTEWILKAFEALPLPDDKILLCGHSWGGWIASIYASYHPDRVESLFLISPLGTETYNEETYDLASMRDMYNITAGKMGKEMADKIIESIEAKKHPYAQVDKLPTWLFMRGLKKLLVRRLTKTSPEYVVNRGKGEPELNEEEQEAFINYLSNMHQRHSVLDILQVIPFKPIGLALHSLTETDRLGNPDVDFPIGIVFGDSDFFGSEGADDIIR